MEIYSLNGGTVFVPPNTYKNAVCAAVSNICLLECTSSAWILNSIWASIEIEIRI